MPRLLSSLLLATALFAACESKVTSRTDQTLLDKIDTVTDCFPGLYDKLDGLLEIADHWRLNTNGSIPDPPELMHSQAGSGEINATLDINTCTLAMTIRFYDPSGSEQNIDLSSVTSLADKIDLAATTLAAMFPSGNSFMVGDWTLTGTKSGSAVNGSGAITGIIGGSTNGNELEEVRTTQATPAGGPPAAASSSISEGTCSLTFATVAPDHLQTDRMPGQEYPIGAVTMTLVGPAATVDATLTFDGTAVIRITLDGVSGRFDFNVETRTLTQVP